MSDGRGPWEPGPAETPPAPPRARRILWIILLAVLATAVVLLARAFPVAEPQDWIRLGGLALMLAYISSRLLTGGPIRWGEKARHAGVWLAIILTIAVGFAYRGELAQVGRRLWMEASPASPTATGSHELAVAADAGHSFLVMGQVNGQPVRFLIDTGASDVVLSPADARRVGIDPASLTFDQVSETANGAGYGAKAVVGSLAVGPVRFAQMPVQVNQADMSSSLLGMTFLSRLDSFQVKDGKFYMRWSD